MKPRLELPSQIEAIVLPRTKRKVFIKRDDLIHPLVSGNKWRKLKWNIDAFQASGKSAILSFGGAFSNHLYALAACGKLFSFPTIGIVRGLEVDLNNPTLSFCQASGMKIIPLSRKEYAQKEDIAFLDNLASKYNAFVVPEGGNNELGVKGCKDIMEEIHVQIPGPLSIAVAVGTGTTCKGLALAKKSQTKIFAFQASNDTEVFKSLSRIEGLTIHPMITPYSRFASMDNDLVNSAAEFEKETGVPLDFVYTAKMILSLEEMIEKGFSWKGNLVLLHTGGLQGNGGFHYLQKNRKKT